MIEDIKKHFVVQEFVPKEVYDQFGQTSWQFVSDNIIKLVIFIYNFFTTYCKANYKDVESISVTINNWHLGGPFSWRCLRTVSYITSQIAKGIKTAMLSQHVGGSSNAVDFNITIKYKDGRKELIDSDKVFDIINSNQEEFMKAGLTTLENKTMTKGWTHGDCRFTGMNKLYIVNP